MGRILQTILAAAVAFCAVTAQAGGSIRLDEVLDAVKDSPKLVAEIQTELVRNNLKAGDVICSAERHGNNWPYLGGSRAAPYECEIGKRNLTIDADRTYFDGRGKLLGNLDRVNPNRARSFKETNFTWKWGD